MTFLIRILALALLLLAGLGFTAQAQSLSPEELARRAVERRAAEAVIWGMPAVNFDLLLQAFLAAKGAPNQVAYWSRPVNWKNQTLTPNPDTIYLIPFYDTRKGPMVLEIPPAVGGSITGSIDQAWQDALEDVGPAGVDKGKGGKYLILPPDHKAKVPAGYIPLRSQTYQGFVVLRSNLKSGSDADIAAAVTYGKRVKFYPLAEAGKAGGPRTTFVDAYDVMFDSTIPYDIRFFESLHRFVQIEPWITRDRAMIDILKTIGIEKGKPFAPDAGTKAILESAAREVRAWIDVRYLKFFDTPFAEGARWALPTTQEMAAAIQNNYGVPNSYPTDARGVSFSIAYFSPKHLGPGQFYLMSIKDKAGERLDASKSYRLRVPANVPAKLYWSVTLYDGATHALIRDSRWSSRASTTPGLQKNSDGSVDLYFGPTAPAGKESNWIPTGAKGPFEALFRIYGPEKPFFEKTWKLPDIERAP